MGGAAGSRRISGESSPRPPFSLLRADRTRAFGETSLAELKSGLTRGLTPPARRGSSCRQVPLTPGERPA
jgi:hypothetical protein